MRAKVQKDSYVWNGLKFVGICWNLLKWVEVVAFEKAQWIDYYSSVQNLFFPICTIVLLLLLFGFVDLLSEILPCRQTIDFFFDIWHSVAK